MFDKTIDYKDYFPSFISEDVKKNETKNVVDEILKLFQDEDIYKANMIHKLTRLIRQLNQFEEIIFLKYVSKEERIFIMQNMWSAIISEKVSLNTKIRFANILASHINNYKKLYLRSWWHSDFNTYSDTEKIDLCESFKCKCDDTFSKEYELVKDGNCICGMIKCNYLIDLIEFECSRDYLDGINTNSQKTKNYISGLIRVLNSYRPYIRESEIDEFINRWFSLSTKSISFFVYSRIFVLICNQYYSFKLIESEKIFEIWEIFNGQLINHWDSLMLVIISRGVRYSWKSGKNLDSIFKRVPFLFEILYSHMGIPILHNIVSNSVNTGATSSTSSISSGSINALTLQPKTPSIIKEIISSEILSTLAIKPVNIYNKFAIIFVHLMKSLRILDNNEESKHVKIIMDSMVNLVDIVYPLNHPSNIGKWSHSISIFIQAITYQYCKRIYRERLKLHDDSKNRILNNLLCRFDDEYVMSILFPLMEQGIYSKDAQIAGRYEDSLKRWTYILPDILLNYLLNIKIIPALENNAETYQIYIALRLLTTITPLIIQFIPESIPRFLEMSLQGIDISDPMKINQTLFFYTVLFYNSQNLNIKIFDYNEYETIEKLSSFLMNHKNNNLEDIKLSFTLYNYPTNIIDYSDKSLQNKDLIPKSIIEYTNINGKSPLELYFQQSSNEFECTLESSKKIEFYFILNNLFTTEILLEKMEHRKFLIETIFNYWIFQFLEKMLKLLENVTKPTETGGYSSSIDLGISYALRALLINIFSKCKLLGYNDTLRDCYTIIGNWILKNYIPDNYKHLSKILSAMGSCDANLSFEIILPKLVGKIMSKTLLNGKETFPDGKDENYEYYNVRYLIKCEIEDESYLLYYVNLISSLIRYTKNSLLNKCNKQYHYMIISLVSNLFLDSRNKVKRSGIKLQQRFVESLTYIQIIEIGEQYPIICDAEKIALSILLWGFPFYSQEKAILNSYQKPQWYIPDLQSLNEVRSILIFNNIIIIKILLDLVENCKETIYDANLSNNGFFLQSLLGYYNREINNLPNSLYISLLNEHLNEREISENKRANNSISVILFCLNNMRLLNKSISTLFPCVRSENFQCFEDDYEHGFIKTICKEHYSEFEPFFSKYYQDCYQIILFLCEIFAGIKMVDIKLEPNCNETTEYYYELITPMMKVTNTEEIKFKTKLIKTINQFLNHYYSSSSNLSLSSLYNTDFSESVLSWLSFTNGLFFQSSMINSPRIFWLKNIQYYWNKRINLLRHQYLFSGNRKKLIYLISLFSLGNYHIIRKSAQSTLKEALNSHISSRNNVLQFIFFEVLFSAIIFQMRQNGNKNSIEDYLMFSNQEHFFEKTLHSNFSFLVSNTGDSKNERNCHNQIFDNDNYLEEYLFNHLSGLSFIIINNMSFQRLLWNNFDLLLQYFIICSYSSSIKLTRETIPVRLLNSLNFVMNNRDFRNILFPYKSTNSFENNNIFQIKLDKLLNQIQSNHLNQTLLYIRNINSTYINEKIGPIEKIKAILVIIIKELNSLKHNIFIDTMSIRKSFTLLILVQGIINNVYDDISSIKESIVSYWNYLWSIMLESDKFNYSNFYFTVVYNLTILTKLLMEKDMNQLNNLISNNALFNKTNVVFLLSNMVIIISNFHHNSNVLNSNQTNINSRTDRKLMNSTNTGLIINNIILSYNSMLNPFPYHRIKCYSNNLSLTNIIFFQTIFLILFIKQKSQSQNTEENNFFNAIIEKLFDWSKKTSINVEKERHLVILEVISSLFSVSTYSVEMDDFLINNIDKDKLLNILFTEFHQSDQDFIFNYMDCIKYSLTPISRQKIGYYYNKTSTNLINNPLTKFNKILLEFILNPFSSSITDGDHNILTFELIKYLRIYQSGLIELIMNNNDNISQDYVLSTEFKIYFDKGVNILGNLILKDNNYKQLREEISNMLHTMILSCNLIYSSVEEHKLVIGYKSNLEKEIKNILMKLNEDMSLIINDSKNDVIKEDSNLVASKLILKAEVILYYCLLKDLYSNNKSNVKIENLVTFNELFDFIYRLQIINNNNDVIGLSYNSLMSLLLTQGNSFDLSKDKLTSVVNRMMDYGKTKCRLFQIRVNTIIGEFYSLLINNTGLQQQIINNIIYGFLEDQSEIKYISKQAFCSLFRTLPASKGVNYIKAFISLINNSQSIIEEKNHYATLLNIKLPEHILQENQKKRNEKLCGAGILGLISVILSHPFDIPFWLPETITFLANCNSKNIPQVLKKQIQECIQEFLKTHQDGWNVIHKYKFSSYQLEVLDTYKGRPTYFI